MSPIDARRVAPCCECRRYECRDRHYKHAILASCRRHVSHVDRYEHLGAIDFGRRQVRAFSIGCDDVHETCADRRDAMILRRKKTRKYQTIIKPYQVLDNYSPIARLFRSFRRAIIVGVAKFHDDQQAARE